MDIPRFTDVTLNGLLVEHKRPPSAPYRGGNAFEKMAWENANQNARLEALEQNAVIDRNTMFKLLRQIILGERVIQETFQIVPDPGGGAAFECVKICEHAMICHRPLPHDDIVIKRGDEFFAVTIQRLTDNVSA